MKVVKLSDGSNLYDSECFYRLQAAGELAFLTLEHILLQIKPGITTLELDKQAEEFIRERGGIPLFKGYDGFPHTTCLSVGEDIVHGIPSSRSLLEGDIISVDVGVQLNGFCGDNARTVVVGVKDTPHKTLIDAAELAFLAGVGKAYPGNTIGDIGFAIQKSIFMHEDLSGNGLFKIFKNFQGHGIGLDLHEAPQVPNYGFEGKGTVLQPGLCICIEPVVLYRESDILIEKSKDFNILQFKTSNAAPSSHFENQLFITNDGPIILTKKP